MIVVSVGAAIVRLCLGLLFIAAGAFKARRARAVRRVVERYRLLPAAGAAITARLLAPVEIATGALVILSLWAPIHALAWVAAAGLLTLFSVAVGSALARGIVVPCGCGPLLGDHVITPLTLARNVALLSILTVDFALAR